MTVLEAPVAEDTDHASPPSLEVERQDQAVDTSSDELPPLSPRMQLVRGVILMVLVLCLSLLFHVTILSHFQQEAAQQQIFDEFRSELATGVAPTGPVDTEGNLLALGTGVAKLEIPSIDLNQIVVEGTTSAALFTGPGHRRDTALPGQQGVSVIMGRRGAYGGPFAPISSLEAGDVIAATTAQGQFEYQVIGVRSAGDPLPPALEAGGARLILVTAGGSRYFPSGVVQVDADLIGEPAVGPARPFTFATLPAAEKVLVGDTSTLWALALWLQLLTALSVAALLVRARWGRARAWIVGAAPMLLVGMATSSEIVRLLPNLM